MVPVDLAGLRRLEVMAAAVGVEAHWQAVLRENLFQRPEGRVGSFRRLRARLQRALCDRARRQGLGLHPDPRRRPRRDPVRAGRSGRSATTIACPSGRSSSRSRKPRCAPTSSKPRSGSTSIPTAPTPSSTGHGASAATTRKDSPSRSCAPPKSARRPQPVDMWTTLRLAHMPTGEQNQKKRTFDVLPKPDNLIRYRHDSALSWHPSVQSHT